MIDMRKVMRAANAYAGVRARIVADNGVYKTVMCDFFIENRGDRSVRRSLFKSIANKMINACLRDAIDNDKHN
jgi:hypothetical protein